MSIMALFASREGKSEKSNEKLQFRMSSKHPDLLPLLKGSWLIKNSASARNKRRFFQLSQDYTSLRWAWNSYVLLYYVDELSTDDRLMTISLSFEMEPDLVMKFEDLDEYETWKRGFTVVLALLLSPDEQVEHLRQAVFTSKTKAEAEAQGLNPFDALVRRLGISTTRHHTYGSTHPEKEARRQLKKSKSGNTTTIEEPQGKKQVFTKQSTINDEAVVHCQSSRIASVKAMIGVEPLSNQISLDSQDTSGGSSNVERELSSAQEDPARLLHQLTMSIESIEYSDLEFGKLLGSGAEGAVWAAWYLDTPVAVKKTDSANEQKMIMSAGQHDNIVGLRGLAREGSSTYIVLEYCPRGTLDVMLHHTMTSRWDPKKVLQIIRGIARGVLHLHSRKPAILHRDLKPANVFVSHGLVMKIGDFGMSRHIQGQPTQGPSPPGRKLRRLLTPGVIGTACYAAPEILDDRLQSDEYDVSRILKADVYSFGVMMWEIVERKRPFEGMQFYEIVASWTSEPKSMELAPFTVPRDFNQVDQKLLKWVQDLTKQCTNLDPNRRPDMKTVVKELKEIQTEVERTSAELLV